MKRFDYRLIIGAALVLGGILMLLDNLKILNNSANIFLAILMVIGAAILLFWFFTNRERWWSAIPGFTLAGMAASTVLPDKLGWGGFAFLGGIGIGFWAVYLRRTEKWWAMIPGGVLVTLGFTAVLNTAFGIGDTRGVFFVGLGLTFLLVALLAKMKWAYIPAGVLLLLGFFIGAPFLGAFEYIWIGILVLAGLLLLISAFRKN